MNRRDALSRVALLFGGTIVGAEFFLSGCKAGIEEKATLAFSDKTIALLNEVGETILPATNTPGAKAADVGSFMKVYVNDCYTPQDQQIFIDGIEKLKSASEQQFSKSFMDLSPEQREELLTALDKEAKAYQANKKEGDPNHYFTLLKQLTLLGFFTSKPGATEALRYVAVPGRFEGCIDYKKGDRAWAIS